ncbi:MAG: hypothetical protein J1F66_04280 [Clostridiales bacterium]|nr:hypothetical protein [Clostridiales bacterium]
MRFQSKSSFIYMFRNLRQLFFITLPISILWAFFYNPRSETDLFVALIRGQINAENFFNEFAKSFTVLRFGRCWWVVLLAVIFLAYTMSVMVVKIDRHMRIGEMLALPLKRAFGIFPMMLLYIVGCLVVYEVFMLIILGVVSMMRFVPSVEAIVGIGFGLTYVARAFLTYIFCLLIITFPLKYSENYRLNIAMSYSARVMAAKRSKVIILSVVYPLAWYLVMALAYLVRPVDVFVYAVANFFVLTYIPCLAFKQFFDDVGGERRDVSQIIFG